MAADQTGDRGDASAAVWQTELTPAGAEVQMKTPLAAAVSGVLGA